MGIKTKNTTTIMVVYCVVELISKSKNEQNNSTIKKLIPKIKIFVKEVSKL
jgi:hypothetical protein